MIWKTGILKVGIADSKFIASLLINFCRECNTLYHPLNIYQYFISYTNYFMYYMHYSLSNIPFHMCPCLQMQSLLLAGNM